MALAAALAFGACGGGDDGANSVPRRVPVALVPARLLADSLGVFENRAASTRKAVSRGVKGSLVDDTRIWEVRRGQRLVGTLQISAVDRRVELTDDEVRDRFARQLIVGARQQIRVGDVEAYRAVMTTKRLCCGSRATSIWCSRPRPPTSTPTRCLPSSLAIRPTNPRGSRCRVSWSSNEASRAAPTPMRNLPTPEGDRLAWSAARRQQYLRHGRGNG